jgi:UDP-2,3-diacylglucosamine pyrophosphatase LpxH
MNTFAWRDDKSAEGLAKMCLRWKNFSKGNCLEQDSSGQFSDSEMQIKIHGHCHQKALSTIEATFDVECTQKNKVIYNSAVAVWQAF